MRVTILLLALAFTVTLGAFTARDLSQHGATVPGVAGAFVVILLFVALLGALLHPPRR